MNASLDDAVDAQKFLTLKIIVLALMAGATIFLLVAGVIIGTASEKAETTEANFLTFAVMVGATWGVSLMLKLQLDVLFKRKLAEAKPFSAYQTQIILRMALSEGPALFGLVGLIVFGPMADAEMYPKLLVFLFPYLSLLGTGIRYFPSQDDFKDRVRVATENRTLR